VFIGSGVGPRAEQPISAFGYFNVAYTDRVQLTTAMLRGSTPFRAARLTATTTPEIRGFPNS
jgi:hypothetical protein